MRAFPTHDADNSTDPRERILTGGMDLRDWFAGMALQGIIASFAHPQARYVCIDDNNMKLTVGDSYKIADAMLEARNAKT